MSSLWTETANGAAVALAALPDRPLSALCDAVAAACAEGGRLACWCGDGAGRLVAVVCDDARGRLLVARAVLPDSYPALTLAVPQAHLFERELAEQHGVVAEGHPWFKPLRYHHRPDGGPDAWGRLPDQPIQPAVADMFRVEGEGVHEVAVGPVHAGVIEPGHFRFQCHGEHVFHLEIHLGYQHRGIERALVGGPGRRTVHQLEAAAGDTSIGHAWAHALAVEALAGVQAPEAANRLRAVMLELERLANHTGDLGALAGDTGFLPTASFNGRIRGDFLNLSALVCGSRLGRGMVRPGGVAFAIDDARRAQFRSRLDAAARDVTGACELLFASPSVQARFEGVGVVRPEDAAAAGIVGVARRACGVARDARQDLRLPPYDGLGVAAAVREGGDVNARAQVRYAEIQGSVALIRRILDEPGALGGPLRAPVGALKPDHLAIGIVEGWRGPLLHLAITGGDGRFTRYKVVDPSFHNWFALMLALRDEQVSDFPLCNKSFNLSYCGVDL